MCRLTDAIRNLARQAGINYMLDPKIGFGQVGPDGKTSGQPNVSIRWENITAEQALAALLNNYTLQLVEDPKSKIARITTKDPAALPPSRRRSFSSSTPALPTSSPMFKPRSWTSAAKSCPISAPAN